MTSRPYSILPFDSMAFRDGRPFEQGDVGLAEAASVFPPPLPAVAGALMVAMAASIGVAPSPPRGRRWVDHAHDWLSSNDERQRWRGQALADILATPVVGPLLGRIVGGALTDIHFPAPADLVFAEKDVSDRPSAVARLAPGDDRLTSNAAGSPYRPLTLVRANPSAKHKAQPQDELKKASHGTSHWIEETALRQYLASGALPPTKQAVLFTGETVHADRRIGIGVNKETGTARTSQLYAVGMQSLRSRAGAELAIVGFGPDIGEVDEVVPFGGEGRFARVRSHSAESGPGPGQAKTGGGRPLLLGVTPVRMSKDEPFGIRLPDGPAFAGTSVVASASGRAAAAGYLDPSGSDGAVRVERFFPAGSVWYLDWDKKPADPRARLADMAKASGSAFISAGTGNLGFGAFLVGTW